MTIKITVTDMPNPAFLADIHKACFENAWDRNAIQEIIDIPSTRAFIAPDGIGFGLLRHLGNEAELLTIAVLTRKRRLGVGAAIMQSMREWARTQGVGAIFLEVSERNNAAAKLYEKCGFTVISRRKNYYRAADGSEADALVMCARLK